MSAWMCVYVQVCICVLVCLQSLSRDGTAGTVLIPPVTTAGGIPADITIAILFTRSVVVGGDLVVALERCLFS